MRLMWDTVGERVFEAGVDRGVLFMQGMHHGIPWNGLISVAETPSGGEITPYYIDGIKYVNYISREEFEATIVAFTYPDEFAHCDGTLLIKNGLFAGQQPKKSFGLCYRTKVGNDVAGLSHGYKIHLVYNATVSPTERPNTTITDEIEPFNFSWHIVTRSPMFVGYTPTAHFVIDSREVPSDLLKELEDILYGTMDASSRLPTVPELIFMFNEYQASIFDAGFLTDEYFNEFDAGHIPEPQTSTIDGGGP